MEIQRTTALAALLLLGYGAWAQGSAGALGGASDAAQRVYDRELQQPADTIHDLNAVEVQPEFPGGMDAMYKYLQQAIHYPDQAVKDSVGGRVYVEFIVGSNGKVRDAKIRRGVRKDLDAEAVRAVMAMPVWSPGRLAGKPVATRFTLPVNFTM